MARKASGPSARADRAPKPQAHARTSDDERRRIADRLRRVSGQIGGVARMVEEREDCEKILTQIMAARAALERAAGLVVVAHIDECLEIRPREEASALISRVVGLLARST